MDYFKYWDMFIKSIRCPNTQGKYIILKFVHWHVILFICLVYIIHN